MLDGVIAPKLKALERALSELRSIGPITAASLSENWQLRRAVERNVLILVDVVVEVAQRAAGNTPPKRLPSAADAIARCVRLGALSGDANYVRLARLASFPAYRYEAIDPALLVEIVNEQLDDFGRFHDEMAAHFQRGEQERAHEPEQGR